MTRVAFPQPIIHFDDCDTPTDVIDALALAPFITDRADVIEAPAPATHTGQYL